MSQVGILGGAFDPPHLEHINIALHACKELNLNQLIFLPTKNPPHKTTSASAEDRLEMLRLCTKSNDKFAIDDFEIKKNKTTYTLETIPYLKEKYGDDCIYIIGGDSIINLHSWYKPEEIVKNIKIAVVYRNYLYKEIEDAVEYWGGKGGDITILKYNPSPISSTFLRFELNVGGDCSKLVCSGVYDYIEDKNLYRDYDKYLVLLRKTLSMGRYLHSVRVAEYALFLNRQLRLNEEKVIIASILHDCAKADKVMSNYLKEIDDAEYKKWKKYIMDNGRYSPVLHAFIGAEIARDLYKIEDAEILDAIRYHTTGRANMSNLEKIVYASDFLELGRKHDVAGLRKIIEKDFDEGFKAIIKTSYDFLMANKKDQIDKFTIEAYNRYVLGK